MKKQHWQDWVNLALGLWIFASPWVFRGATGASITWNMYIVGIAIAATAIGALILFQTWEEWVNIVLGGWLLLSPWILEFSSSALLTWNAVIAGAIVVIAAGWALSTEKGGEQRSPFL